MTPNAMTLKDRSPYLSLFSHPRMVTDLLRGYVREPWVDRVDPVSFELWPPAGEADEEDAPPEPGGGPAGTIEANEADAENADAEDKNREDALDGSLVWRLRWQGGRSWIYLLLAFPAAVDPRFALHLLGRSSRLHLALEARRELPRSGFLPTVVPVALYRGGDLWTAPRDLADLAEPAPHGLGRHAAAFRYLLLDATREPIPLAGAEDNLVSALFRLERARTLDAVAGEAERLGRRLAGPADRPLRLAFTALLNDPRLPRHFPGMEICGLSGLGGLGDLADLADLRGPGPRPLACSGDWTRQWGEHRRGLVRLLLRLLEGRFGPLRPAERELIEQSAPERLLAWAERATAARSLEEVFAEAGQEAG